MASFPSIPMGATSGIQFDAVNPFHAENVVMLLSFSNKVTTPYR
jgi:hypothetical protein